MDIQLSQTETTTENLESLQFQTNDEKLHTVSLKLANQMGVVRQMAQNYTKDLVVPLPKVDAKTFAMVLTWCAHMQKLIDNGEQPPNSSIELGDLILRLVPDLNVGDAAYRLTAAASYLEINSLFEATTQNLANQINKCESVEEFRERFDVPEVDFPSDDETNEERT